MKDEGPSLWAKSLGLFSVIVTDIGGGVVIGYLAWHYLGAPWWVLLATSLAGICLSMYRAYRMENEQEKTK